MNHQHLRDLIFENAQKNLFCNPKTEAQWSEVFALLTEDQAETVRFFKNECSVEILFWVAPLLGKVNRVFKSAEFVKFLRWHLEDLLEYPYCMENLLTPFMRNYVSESDFAETVRKAIDEAEAVIES